MPNVHHITVTMRGPRDIAIDVPGACQVRCLGPDAFSRAARACVAGDGGASFDRGVAVGLSKRLNGWSSTLFIHPDDVGEWEHGQATAKDLGVSMSKFVLALIRVHAHESATMTPEKLAAQLRVTDPAVVGQAIELLMRDRR